MLSGTCIRFQLLPHVWRVCECTADVDPHVNANLKWLCSGPGGRERRARTAWPLRLPGGFISVSNQLNDIAISEHHPLNSSPSLSRARVAISEWFFVLLCINSFFFPPSFVLDHLPGTQGLPGPPGPPGEGGKPGDQVRKSLCVKNAVLFCAEVLRESAVILRSYISF